MQKTTILNANCGFWSVCFVEASLPVKRQFAFYLSHFWTVSGVFWGQNWENGLLLIFSKNGSWICPESEK